jgi:hypothetical protein
MREFLRVIVTTIAEFRNPQRISVPHAKLL